MDFTPENLKDIIDQRLLEGIETNANKWECKV